MENTKVSVIIPVYNAEKFLEKCLKSVVNQTLKDIEIICVDDGSTDSSLEIINSFRENDSRIKVLTQKNEFAGVARNNGMKIATGKYFAFWDADDFFEADALEVLYSCCEKENADICLCSAYDYNSETGKRQQDQTFLKKRFLPKGKVFSKKTCPEYIFNIASNVPWQRLFRAQFIKEHALTFQPLQKANDTYFVMLATYFAERITFTEKPLINYRTNNSESITGTASKNPLCAYESYLAVYERLRQENPGELVWQSFYNRLLSGLFRSVLLQTTEESIKTVYDKIKNEGITAFGIDKHLDREYYYFQKEYDDLMIMLNHSHSEYLMYKYRKENADKLFYKAQAEKKLSVKMARRLSRFISADSALYDLGKRLLHFK